MSSIPGGIWLWDSLIHWWALPLDEWLKQTVELILQIAGCFEFYRLIDRRLFKRRSRLEAELEALELRIVERNATIATLTLDKEQLIAELKAARDELPGAAIARAEREFADSNQELAIGHLENWFVDNASSIASISKHLARYHIAHAVPDAGKNLHRARDMLQMARGASPADKEVRELSGELNAISAALQQQLIRDGEKQIAWNSAMAPGLTGRGETLMPLVTLLRDIASWCFENGKWRLAPIFADRAADLARRGGTPLRRVWCQTESRAAFYQIALGHLMQALDRVDHVLAKAREVSTSLRDLQILEAQAVRAQVLHTLGRNNDALAEIEAFAPIQAEVLGGRHPDTLTLRYLRAQVLHSLGRDDDALAAIEAFAPIEAEVLGARHPSTLAPRSLRVQVLSGLGRDNDALAEIEAFAPIQEEMLGARHPNTVATRYLRAQVLHTLGRDDDALAEIEAFAPMEAEVLGARHPSTLATRSLYCKLTSAVQKS